MNAAIQLKILQSASPDGCTITITRGGTSVTTRALRGFTRGQMVGGDGSMIEFFTADFLVTVFQTGAIGRPQRGDVITRGESNFTVAHPDPNSKAVVFHGNDETAYRIHTIQEGI